MYHFLVYSLAKYLSISLSLTLASMPAYASSQYQYQTFFT